MIIVLIFFPLRPGWFTFSSRVHKGFVQQKLNLSVHTSEFIIRPLFQKFVGVFIYPEDKIFLCQNDYFLVV